MEWSKLKTIIILLLLVVNLFLLALTGGHWQQRHQTEEELRRDAVDFVRSKGISLDAEAVPHDPTLSVQSTDRDLDAEEKIAERALNHVQLQTEQPMREYQGKRGSARFYADGRFLLTFSDGSGEHTTEPEQHAVSYLKNLGIPVSFLDSSQKGNETLVRVLQQLDGVPIFTCRIDLSYQNGILSNVQGWRILGKPVPNPTEKEPFDTATLLLRFIEALQEDAVTPTELRRITMGYGYATANLSARSELIPLWCIESESQIYYLNCLTGELESSTIWLHV